MELKQIVWIVFRTRQKMNEFPFLNFHIFISPLKNRSIRVTLPNSISTFHNYKINDPHTRHVTDPNVSTTPNTRHPSIKPIINGHRHNPFTLFTNFKTFTKSSLYNSPLSSLQPHHHSLNLKSQ